MTPRISIIVPAYNAAHTLPDCLDSLLAQTEADIEVLVIDDGSTDGTGAVLADYAARDPRVLALIQPRNAGVSSARNVGLAQAGGRYIAFCDADDWAEPGMYGSLADGAETADAQVAFCAVVKEYPAGPQVVPLPWEAGTVLDRQGIQRDLIPRMISLENDGEEIPLSGYTPRNLFARELLADMTFRPDIHYAEDLLFILTALMKARRVAVVGGAPYHYRFHAGSTTQRYSPHIPQSFDQTQAALTSLLAHNGLGDSLGWRLDIRARRNVLNTVVNLCLPGTPYGLGQRVREIAKVLREPGVQLLYRGVRTRGVSRKQAVKLWLVRHRCSLALMLLYSYGYRAR